jgi:hypothetical protein
MAELPVNSTAIEQLFQNITLKAEFVPPKMVNTRWEVSSSKLKEPYAGFLQSKDFEHGRSTDTANEPILTSLYTLLLNYNLLRSKITDLNKLIADLIKPERVTANQFLL